MTREIEVKFRLNDPARLRARLGACGARRVACVHETNRIFDTAERTLLAADCGLRLRTCRPLVADCRRDADAPQSPIANPQSPIANPQSPIANPQSPAAASATGRAKPGGAKNRAPSASAGSSNAGMPVARAPGSDRGRSVAPDLEATATLTYKGPRAPGETKIREEIETVVADADATATILQRLGFNEVIVYEKRRETWRLDDCEVCLDELPKLGWFIEIEGPSRDAVETACTRLELPAATPLRETYVELAATHGDPGPSDLRRLRFEGSGR